MKANLSLKASPAMPLASSTGLPDRRAFTDSLRALRLRNASGALGVVDLDHFKLINHQHGHQAGDAILVAVAARLKSTLTADVLIARHGGDGLAILVPGDTVSRKGGKEKRMRSAVEAAAIAHRASPTAPVITITVGVASSQGRSPCTIHQLMNLAAQAAMEAKIRAQRNRVLVA